MEIAKYLSAMKKRCSRRKYTDRPIDSKCVKKLEDRIALCNRESGLNMKLVIGNGGKLFDGFRKSYGLFVGVQDYIAMIGSKTLPDRMEKVGRFGEKLILEATAMGLSTCWVGTSYDKNAAMDLCERDEVLDCVIAVGYSDEKHSLKERMMEYGMHRQNKTKEALAEAEDPVPEWFKQGIDAVYLAPTARNLRPFVFKYKDGQVTASITSPTETAMIDLGIAKFHFELGARVGSWEYGNGGRYCFDDKQKDSDR
ncbi:nitroreductase family protein [Pseudoramibacter sp. HA2172]|uniref:nitroreductase family protein n=1 Tax=Pseudoramibacter faecis TaxID=3108534 RepID=UPI002E787B2D|nr:nitroreductase family protein [Pseudoramibacter sp. HA2172]